MYVICWSPSIFGVQAVTKMCLYFIFYKYNIILQKPNLVDLFLLSLSAAVLIYFVLQSNRTKNRILSWHFLAQWKLKLPNIIKLSMYFYLRAKNLISCTKNMSCRVDFLYFFSSGIPYCATILLPHVSFYSTVMPIAIAFRP